MAGKSPEAFRTISEVADWLDSPAHVLRFWESKFNQIKPVKRAGGRRYYRPEDMLLLGGIKKLLHDDGLTIKGAQKVLRDQGVRYVSGLSQPLDDDTAALSGELVDAVAQPPVETAAPPRARPVALPDPEPPLSPEILEDMPQDAAQDEPALQDETAEDAAQEPAPRPAMPEMPAAQAPVATPPRPALGTDLPPPPDLNAIQPEPGVLSAIAARLTPIPAQDRAALTPILARLDDMVARLSNARKG